MNNFNLAISFYMDNSLAVLNWETENLVEVPVQRPMGIGVTPTGLYLGSRYGVSWFERIYHCLEDKWLYRQNFTKYMGFIDCHELVIAYGKPIFANTLFSCVSFMASNKDFHLYSQPKFIKELRAEDNCHLNGIALEDGMPRYVTCFAPNNEPGFKSWKHKPLTGCVWDLASDRAVISDLALPHSPRVIDDDLFVCDSGRGSVLRRSGDKLEAIANLGSFTRGMIATDDYLIIGTSKVREKAINPQIDKSKLTVNRCGLHVCDRHNFRLLESYYFQDKTEIFDFQLIPENHYIVSADSEPFKFIHLL
jgi:uncharacterized protein (TIGR03032 family)